MRSTARLLLLLAFVSLPLALLPAATPACAEDAPPSRLDRVDYKAPKTYLAMGPKIGAGQRTHGIARQLRGAGAPSVGMLGKIIRWTRRNLRVVPGTPVWRTMDEVVKSGRVATESERAYGLGVLLRATGVPVTWVKAVSQTGLSQAKMRGSRELPATRTFLEVHLAGAWRLVDPVTARIYDSYDPRRQLLPEGFLAYDKSGDPYTGVLDNRPTLFRQQLAAYIAAFEVKRLPWAASRDLLAPWRVFITGQSGAATYAREAARTLGFLVEKRFDSRWVQNLAAARGKTLIVTSRGGKPTLPASFHAAWLPKGWQAAASNGKGWVAHQLADGTRVILVVAEKYGPVELAVSEALDG